MPLAIRYASTFPSSLCSKQFCLAVPSSRSFSATTRNERRTTRNRRMLFRWLSNQGKVFLHPRPDSTNYMSAYNAEGELKRVVEARAENEKKKEKKQKLIDAGATDPDSDAAYEYKASEAVPAESSRDRMPYPLNKAFVSQPVLTEDHREEIWKRVMKDGKSVRQVSAEMKIEMGRVAAVVRLTEVEKNWIRIGKPLVRSYGKAVMGMLPKSPFDPNGLSKVTHESINDLPVHYATGQQIFHPAPESRHFTREDAAKIFHSKLLPADDRVPHPELTEMHKEFKLGLTRRERQERDKLRHDAENEKIARSAARKASKLAAIKSVNTGRFEYRFTNINVDNAGKDGRGHKGVGWRYGAPLMDRKRGEVKIPTSAE